MREILTSEDVTELHEAWVQFEWHEVSTFWHLLATPTATLCGMEVDSENQQVKVCDSMPGGSEACGYCKRLSAGKDPIYDRTA